MLIHQYGKSHQEYTPDVVQFCNCSNCDQLGFEYTQCWTTIDPPSLAEILPQLKDTIAYMVLDMRVPFHLKYHQIVVGQHGVAKIIDHAVPTNFVPLVSISSHHNKNIILGYCNAT